MAKTEISNFVEIALEYLKKNIEQRDGVIAEKLIEEYPEIANQYKGRKESLRKRLCEIRKNNNLPLASKTLQKKKVAKIPEIIQEDKHILNLRSENSEFKKKYFHTLKELEEANKRLDIILDVKEEPSKIYKIPYKDINKEDSESVAVAVGSDWHIGEIVDASTVNGLNKFDMHIGRKRVDKFFSSIIKLLEIERKGTKIDTLILALLGDLMSGYIHEELMENSDLSPTETIIELRDMIISGIDLLKKKGNLKKIIIPTAIGNHGRTTLKRRVATASKNSYEWLLYNILKSDYKNDEQVEILVSNGYHNWVNVFGKYDLRFHHGDSINYWGGMGGITIPANKAIAQWNKIKYAYLDIFGHFHTFLNGGNFICNSSLVGYNAFALSIKASYEEPKQTFFTIDKDRGVTAVRPIFVTEK